MEKTFNLRLLKAKEEIFKALNDAEIPIIVSQMIINEIKNVVDINAENIINKEKMESFKNENDETNKEVKNKKGNKK